MALSSSEIKDEEDLEVGLMATCRICFQCDGEEDEDLISPCMCKGSHLFVHRSCLDHWRSIKVIGILGGISYLADKHEYLRDLLKDDFNTIVIYYGTGVMVFFMLHGSVAFMVIFFAVDDNGRMGCCARSDMNPLFWLLVGMMFCLHVITGGLFGVYFALDGASTLIQWILNRHNSILAKKELTKEYVVEDLHGFYTPAKLDPEHLERLKALKLF
ncbi:zinc finger, RING-CH-type containing protein [Tanacetum coccineum]